MSSFTVQDNWPIFHHTEVAHASSPARISSRSRSSHWAPTQAATVATTSSVGGGDLGDTSPGPPEDPRATAAHGDEAAAAASDSHVLLMEALSRGGTSALLGSGGRAVVQDLDGAIKLMEVVGRRRSSRETVAKKE